MRMIANLNTGQLHVEGIKRIIPISCNVRNELNHRRRADEVVLSMPSGKPYYPRQFPLGIWKVLEVRDRKNDPYRAPYFIATTAHQEVEVWSVIDGPNGKSQYNVPTGEMTEDREYGLHCSTSPTTTGCIKIANLVDLLELVNLIHNAEILHEKVFLEVLG
jgi:hypothetical protein